MRTPSPKDLHYQWVQQAEQWAGTKAAREAALAPPEAVHDAQLMHDRAVQLAIMFGLSAILEELRVRPHVPSQRVEV